MPLLRKRRVLAAKIETTPGTPIALGASDGVFNVFDAEIQPDIEFTERSGQSAFSPLPGTNGVYSGTLTFKHELIPGSSAHPAWASTFLPACGFVASSNIYSPTTAAPGSSVKTLTMALYEDGQYKTIFGAMGTAKLVFETGKPVMIEFTFRGVWATPTDVAMIAPTYPTILPLTFRSAGLTIGAWSPAIEKLEIDFGNEVILREDANTSTGLSTALITGRRITGTVNPESVLVATKNYYSEWLAHTEQSLAIALASGGIGVSFAAPKFQITGVNEGDRNGVQIDDIAFQLNRSAAAGDDELTITFDITP